MKNLKMPYRIPRANWIKELIFKRLVLNHSLKKTGSVKLMLSLVVFKLIIAHSYAQSFVGAGNQSLNNSATQQFNNSLRGSGMMFTPNKGQIADTKGNLCPEILYKGDGGGADVYLRKTGISYVTSNMGEVMREIDKEIELRKFDQNFSQQQAEELKHRLEEKALIKIQRTDVDFAGGNPNPQTLNQEEVEGYTNYYYAHCPNGITNVKSYNRVVQKNIYKGIDVIYYGGKANGLKYDIVVNPGGNTSDIKLKYSGTGKLIIKNGKLIIKTSLEDLNEYMPKVYQNINGKIVDVKARYLLDRTTLSFELETLPDGKQAWNPSFPLVIDPWLSYYGGSADDNAGGSSVTTDPSGNVLVAGNTMSTNFPITTGAFQTTMAGIFNAFAFKMDASGNVIWSTYLGGSSNDWGYGIACDAVGNILVSGNTTSADLPVGFTGANVVHQTVYGTGVDAFLLKLDVNGARLWATFYGGLLTEYGYDVTTDGNNVYLYGYTNSTNAISTPLSFQPALNGTDYDAYLVKFNSNGSRVWSTYAGGSNYEAASGVCCDPMGNIYITGGTLSTNFPCAGAFQTVLSGKSDAYLVKFNSAGAVLWSTFYGGTGGDSANAIDVDGTGSVIIGGTTDSPNVIGAVGAYQSVYGGGALSFPYDGFIVKFNNTGAKQWGTYIGGNQGDMVWGIATDINNNIYVSGDIEDTGPGNFVVSSCAYQTIFGGPAPGLNSSEDQFIGKFDPAGNLKCMTYLGGTGHDDTDGSYGGSIDVYGNSLYISGYTSGGYPVTNGAFQTASGGEFDAFIDQLCINLCESKILGLNFVATTTSVCTNTLVKFTPAVTNSCDTSGYKYQWTFTGGTPSSSSSINPSIIYSSSGTYPVKLVVTTFCKKDSVIKPALITVNNCGCVMSAAASVTTNISCNEANDGSAMVTIGSGSGGPYTYSWSNGLSGATTATTIPVTGLSPNTYTVTVTEGTCSAISIVTLTPQNTLNINAITATNVAACSGGVLGSATVTLSSSLSGPYTYSWSTGASSVTTSLNNTINNLTSGTYTVTITEGSCKAISTVTITQSQPLVIGTSSQWSCITNKGTATAFPVRGDSPYAYLWSNGQTTITATGLSLGTTYTVTVTDAAGCTATTAATPTILAMVITPSSTNVVCSKVGSAKVTVVSGFPPYTYIWSTGQTTSSIDYLLTGGYTVTVTDGNGCTAVQPFTITDVSPVSATFTHPTVCLNSPVTFTNTGSIGTYSWVISPITPTNVTGTTTDFSYTFLTVGTYTIRHTVTSGGCTNTSTKTITVTNCAGPTITATGSSVCPGTCATLTSSAAGGTGSYTYSWNTGETTQNINPCPTSTTTYTVKVTDGVGATATSTAVVTVNPAVTVTATSTNITCNGTATGSVTATPAGGTPAFNYVWSNGITTSSGSNLAAGNYTVTVIDSKGCTAISTTTINSPPALIAQYTKGTANCSKCGCKEWVMVTGINGTPPYNYQWPDGYDKRYKNALCPGVYNVIVTDNNGCKTTVKVNAP